MEELLTLASCAPAPSLSDPLKFCIQCVESQLLVVIMSVSVSLVNFRVYVCVCMYACTHIMFLFLVPFFWVWLSVLSPVTSVPQPEREEMLLYLRCVKAAGTE